MIETARLVLKPITEADKGWVAAQAADPQVMTYLGGPMARTMSDEKVDKMIRLQADRGFSFFGLFRKDHGRPIGLCGLKLFDAEGATLPGELEIGWRIDADCWGQGYAREAASVSLDYAFGVVKGERVIAITSPRNRGSWGLMERLGMTRRPDLDFNDVRVPPEDNPTILYMIEAKDWEVGAWKA
ncbi:Protein N-acetyltransferase, RimJ/RimL family [Sphingomonas laterariae]|uniref:Protein N-acetyltransferase, RimJ/RimL family n=1 Tax=Edaphosphingomonas laterariae TaxID=861865 RepID=A0A239FXM0_9SPHN|nr:GNAT family N-acetyltransferase [Sphingomonas laterariae]SNS61936.1 Protein N-acetyltransferase, RimJ/RimL family [Sphingomonas laterariae]